MSLAGLGKRGSESRPVIQIERSDGRDFRPYCFAWIESRCRKALGESAVTFHGLSQLLLLGQKLNFM